MMKRCDNGIGVVCRAIYWQMESLNFKIFYTILKMRNKKYIYKLTYVIKEIKIKNKY